MLKTRNFLIAAISFVVLSSITQAQVLKIGFVKDDDIRQNYKAWQKAQEQWDVEKKAWDDEAQAKQTALQDLLDDYDKQKLILSEDKRKEKEAAIRVKQEDLDNFTRTIYGPGGTAEKKQQELLQPLLDKVTKAIEAVATEGGYDIIFTGQSGLGYIKPTYDVTPKVLEQLDKLEQ
jgi:outer membrane protein